MTNYEGVFIISPELTADAAKGVTTLVQELVSKNGGRVEGIQEWGKRRLAYKINKKQEGNYLIVNYQLDPKQSKKLDQTLRLNDSIMRFMIVNKDTL